MSILFSLVGVLMFLFLMGWPIWLLIYGLIVKKRTGKFPLKKLLIITGITLAGIVILAIGSTVVLGLIQSSTGINDNLNLVIPPAK